MLKKIERTSSWLSAVPSPRDLDSVVQKVDSAIHQINHYSLDSAIGFANTCPLDSDLSGG